MRTHDPCRPGIYLEYFLISQSSKFDMRSTSGHILSYSDCTFSASNYAQNMGKWSGVRLVSWLMLRLRHGMQFRVRKVRIADVKHGEARTKGTMASAHDVAAFILGACGSMTAMKLQKLVYYCQAWSLVWDERPLFPEVIQAWANGPVTPALYAEHRGRFELNDWPPGDPSRIDEEGRDTIRGVISFYGDKTSQWLSDLTHSESPWMDAREGLAPGERGNRVISLSAMAEYYGSL